jgi:hypothetical protein
MLSGTIKSMTAKPARLFLVLAVAAFWVSCAGKPPVETQQIPEDLPQPEAAPLEKPEPAAEPIPEEIPEPEPDPETKPEPEEVPEPEGLVFIPADPPPLVPAPGVGTIQETRFPGSFLTGEDKNRLQNAFRAAYADGLLRGLPLAGVLGGDLVHGWPETEPSGWVQNWRSVMPVPNSWGIPSLILAIQGVGIAREMNRVFIVDGEILNYYGTSAGRNGANGDIGYGSPRGEKFFYKGGANSDGIANGIAQRFDHGLIVIDAQGQGSFLPEDPPSSGAELPPELGVFPEAPQNGNIRNAFLTAWGMALERNIELVPDGPGQYLSASRSGSSDAGTLRGLYIQTFNQRSVLLMLPEASGLPFHVRFLGPPFLEVLLLPKGRFLPGAEGLEPEEIGLEGEDDFTRRLMGGISLYGFPLTDPLPYRAGEDSPWQETQRFSRGWIRESR